MGCACSTTWRNDGHGGRTSVQQRGNSEDRALGRGLSHGDAVCGAGGAAARDTSGSGDPGGGVCIWLLFRSQLCAPRTRAACSAGSARPELIRLPRAIMLSSCARIHRRTRTRIHQRAGSIRPSRRRRSRRRGTAPESSSRSSFSGSATRSTWLRSYTGGGWLAAAVAIAALALVGAEFVMWRKAADERADGPYSPPNHLTR